MSTVLSSRWTPFWKFGFPLVWGSGWSYATAQLFTEPSSVTWEGSGAPPVWAKWLFLAVLIFAGIFFRQFLMSLKKVVLEDDHLRISNYRREIRIPLSEIRAGGIDPNVAVAINSDRRPLVFLHFAQETPFGKLIEFVPESPQSVSLLRGWLRLPESDSAAGIEETRLSGRGTV